MKKFIIENMETITEYIKKDNRFVIWNDGKQFRLLKMNEDHGYCFENYVVVTEENYSELVCVQAIDPNAIVICPYWDIIDTNPDHIIKVLTSYYGDCDNMLHDYIQENKVISIDMHIALTEKDNPEN
jgi:hypothetical protein